MDQGLVELTFSCFIEDKNTETGQVLYTSFPSIQAQKSSEYERIEIPILSPIWTSYHYGESMPQSAVELQRILCQEKQDAYRRIYSLRYLGSVTKIHNALCLPNACSQMSAVSGPLPQWLEDKLEQSQKHLQESQEEKEDLIEELFPRIKQEGTCGRLKYLDTIY